VTIRPFNTYGPRQSARAVIPAIIKQILSGSQKIKIGALTPTRDFSFVSDTVEGFLCAINASEALGEVINLGSNFEISIGETIEIIAGVLGAEIELEQDAIRMRPEKSEVERLWADNSKAKDLLGWSPRYSGKDGFTKGILETVTWFKDSTKQNYYKPEIYNT